MYTYPSVFIAESEHDDGATVVLPDETPEVIFGRWKWTLSSYELALGTVALSINQSRNSD